jgi:hypothetical protein
MTYYEKNKEKVLAKALAYRKSKREYYLWQTVKHRCKKDGTEFTLSVNDIVVPEFCPVLGIKLEFGDESGRWCSPSIDRINPKGGYTKDNIQIISHRANSIKSDGTPEEVMLVAEFMNRQKTQ